MHLIHMAPPHVPHSLVFALSVAVSYFSHDLGEEYVKRGKAGEKRDVRIIVKGYHVHHSFFGAIALAIGLVFTSGAAAMMWLGYGIGNIWQHKLSHNRVKEKGFVFIDKAQKT